MGKEGEDRGGGRGMTEGGRQQGQSREREREREGEGRW